MRCVIISGSPQIDIDFIRSYIQNDDFIICADKGYEYATAAKISPDLVVGDFDSCSDKIIPECETVMLPVHKDDTDTMHAVNIAIERGFSDISILGATGGRIDHTIANISALQYIHEKGAKGCLVSSSEYIEYLAEGSYCFCGYKGKIFSLFPFGCSDVCVSYKNAEYPLNRHKITSSFPLGISNSFISDMLSVDIYDGNAIFIINLKDC